MAVNIMPFEQAFTSPTFIVLFGFLASLVCLHFWMTQRRIAKLGNKIPGIKPLPFIGNVLDQIGLSDHERVIQIKDLVKEYGFIGKCWIGPNLLIFIGDAQDAEVILNSREHLQKSSEYRFFKPWLGDGLLLSSGEKWQRHRKLIAPAFHQNIIKSFIDVFNKNSIAVVKRMWKEIGKEFDVHDYMTGVTVDILLETAMGTPKTHEDEEGFNYAMAVLKLCDILHKRNTIFYLRPDFLFNLSALKKKQDEFLKLVHTFTSNVFETKKAEFQKKLAAGFKPGLNFNKDLNQTSPVKNDDTFLKVLGPRDDLDEQDENDIGEKRRLAFLECMIESAYNGGDITDSEIKEQVDTIMFEGHDTTSAGSSFVLCLLGAHQDIQEKVYEEQKRIFGNSTRTATFADTLEMKYLERVIFETLRLYPPVPIIARKLNQDARVVTNGYILPAGSTIVVCTFLIHRNEKYYKDPDTFNPDNFLPENTQNRHYYSYIPFSAGPRSCVGRKFAMLKLKILISTIIRNYRIKSNVEEKDFRFRGDIILKREDGFRIEIEPRDVEP